MQGALGGDGERAATVLQRSTASTVKRQRSQRGKAASRYTQLLNKPMAATLQSAASFPAPSLELHPSFPAPTCSDDEYESHMVIGLLTTSALSSAPRKAAS